LRAEAFAKLGHDVIVFSLSDHGSPLMCSDMGFGLPLSSFDMRRSHHSLRADARR
jgi:hypothetical protein